MELPLAGVRIVDCSAVISGPLATTLLADQGADVIKVEPPGAGDVLRAVGSRAAACRACSTSRTAASARSR